MTRSKWPLTGGLSPTRVATGQHRHEFKGIASVIIVIVATLFSYPAHSSAGWTDYVSVAELIPTARHYYKFRLPVRKNPSGCKEEQWFYQNYDAQGSDKMFDALLEGIKSGLRLRVYVTGVCNIDGFSEISSIGIIP